MPDYNIFNYWCNAKLVVWHRGLVGFFINKSAFGAKGPRIKSPWRQTVKSMFYISSNKVWLNQNLTPWYTLKSNLDSSPKSRACPRATQQDCAKCGGTPLLSRSWHRKIFRRKADKKRRKSLFGIGPFSIIICFLPSLVVYRPLPFFLVFLHWRVQGFLVRGFCWKPMAVLG